MALSNGCAARFKKIAFQPQSIQQQLQKSYSHAICESMLSATSRVPFRNNSPFEKNFRALTTKLQASPKLPIKTRARLQFVLNISRSISAQFWDGSQRQRSRDARI
jgi:hypothetical protein